VIARTLLTATGLIVAVVVLGCDGASSLPLSPERSPSASAAASARSGELHITKECHEYQGRIGDFCTIVASNVSEIQKGTRVYYLSALNFADPSGLITYNGDVRVMAPGNTAYGHCVLTDFVHALGRCEFAGGTGRFKNFSAGAVVTGDADPVVAHWDGSYLFAK
jgi:hypothetical protein